MITEGKWVLGQQDDPNEDAVKNLRIIWEGLFFGESTSLSYIQLCRLLAL
jgi:hypothetical protein